MKKNILNFRSIAILSAGFALLLSACTRENLVPAQQSLSSNEIAAPAPEEFGTGLYNDLMDPINGNATEVAAYALFDEGIPAVVTEDPFENDNLRSKRPCRMPDTLKLSERQIHALNNARAAFQRCSKEAEMKMRQLNREYVARAEKQRMEILAALKNGRITREEAQRKLNQLNENIRKQLAEDPARARLAAQLRACSENYHTAVKAILTDAQWRFWSVCQRGLYGRR